MENIIDAGSLLNDAVKGSMKCIRSVLVLIEARIMIDEAEISYCLLIE